MKNINLFYAVDDNYVPFLAVTIRSMLENASKDYNYNIKILYTSLSKENMEKVTKEFDGEAEIDFIDVRAELAEIKKSIPVRDYFSDATYYRMFIPMMFPELDKALYVDSDTIVVGDISELYNIDLEDNLVGAAPEGVIQELALCQEYVERVVGIDTYKEYFNAGILLMNLDKIRKEHIIEKFVQLLGMATYRIIQDEDYLNKLCKGKVKYFDANWNRMPVEKWKIHDTKSIKLIHYNLTFKPWIFDNVPYEEFFWKYAKKTSFYELIRKNKENVTNEKKEKLAHSHEQLIEAILSETTAIGDDWNEENAKKIMSKNDFEKKKKLKSRIEVMGRIQRFELNGTFDIDPENDPPAPELKPSDIEYIRKGLINKIKRSLADKIATSFFKKQIKTGNLIIKKVIGEENFNKIDSGAIVTCNHFNPFDSFTVESIYRRVRKDHSKKMYKVIREGNYTNFPGFYGFLFKNCDTLPLSSNSETMKKFLNSSSEILKNKELILMYPEQSMWWNYRKPKPFKSGAFTMAAKNNVPIIPVFITMEDSDKNGEDGLPIQEYTVHISNPIYSLEEKSVKENAEYLKEKNFEIWKNIYEVFYNKPLTYTTINGNIDEKK